MFLIIILYLLVFIQSVINLYIYISNPLKHSTEVKCYQLPCNIYVIYSALMLFTIDVILLGILTLTEPLVEGLPTTWFIFYGFLGYLIIFLIYSNAKIIKKSKKLSPPDESMLNKDGRFSLYLISLILYIIIFGIRYVNKPLDSVPTQPALERFFFNRFGGYKDNNKINFILSYVITISIPIALLRTIDGANYHPSNYNLPLSWKI